MEPGKYRFEQSFEKKLIEWEIERDNKRIAIANGTYVPKPVMDEPPTEKQLYALVRMGCPKVPETKREASRLIGEWQKKKR